MTDPLSSTEIYWDLRDTSSGLGADTWRHTKHITASPHSLPSAVSSGSPAAQECHRVYAFIPALQMWNQGLDAMNDAYSHGRGDRVVRLDSSA